MTNVTGKKYLKPMYLAPLLNKLKLIAMKHDIQTLEDIKLMVIIYEPALTSDTFLVTCSKKK